MYQTIVNEFQGSFAAVPPVIAAIRLSAALFFAGIVGFERERREKPAGLRTHMLVSMAACLFILLSLQLAEMFPDSDIRVDHLRLIEAVTAGVAFLAAGIIFTSGGKVRNTTTGASMWLAGAIGLACGSGQLPLAALATGIVLAVLLVLRQVERWMGTR